MRYMIRVALIIGAATALLPGCGGSKPPIGMPGVPARVMESVQQEATAPAATNRERLLAMTHRIEDSEPNFVDKIVKVREFKLPARQSFTTESIIVGPDRNLWFTELCAVAQITIKGRIRVMGRESNGSAPGLLTIGPDGNVWANTAAVPWSGCSNQYLNEYQIYRVTPGARFTAFSLPIDTNTFPTALLNIDSNLYFGLGVLGFIHKGTENQENFLATISTTDGIIDKVAMIRRPSFTGDGYIMALQTPGAKIWFYDFAGGLHICSTVGRCAYRRGLDPFKYLGNFYGTVMAYSPADKDVYVDNQNYYTILKYSANGTLLRRYKNIAFSQGFGIVAYYRGDIWIALGGDAKARPNLGRLTPSGNFSEISLPFNGPTAAVTALTAGPDGHLWYLRGYHVGEILSKI